MDFDENCAPEFLVRPTRHPRGRVINFLILGTPRKLLWKQQQHTDDEVLAVNVFLFSTPKMIKSQTSCVLFKSLRWLQKAKFEIIFKSASILA